MELVFIKFFELWKEIPETVTVKGFDSGGDMIKNMMFLAVRFIVILIVSQVPHEVFAYHINDSPIRSGFGVITGYKSIDMGEEIRFVHSNHPDDPAGLVPGATTIGPDLEFAYIGIGYQTPLSKSILLNAGLGVLKDFRTNVDYHKADNDRRADKYATYVYSDARVGGFSSLGLSYYFKSFFVGVDAEVDVIKVTHAWDRSIRDDLEAEEIHWIFSAGPKIGCYLFDNLSLEVSALIGEQTSYNALLRWYFFY